MLLLVCHDWIDRWRYEVASGSIRFDSFARSACREIQVVAELAVAVGCCGTYRNFSLKESVAAYPVRRNPT